MTNEEFIILAEKIAEGSASISEIALYNASYESFQQDPQSLTADGLDSKELKKESLARFWKNNEGSQPVVKLWPRIAVTASRSKFGTSLAAAAAVAAIVFGVWFFSSKYEDDKEILVSSSKSQDIAPGKNGATITLANGKVIQLSDAKSGVIVGKDLKYNDGTDLSGSRNEFGTGSRTREATMLTASTARSQTYQFTLPDGTKVWLNADSKISFPSKFSGAEREILLDGEGYFEVAKDKAHPFVVSAKNQDVTVLGTHFNISAYQDERLTTTTLVEGSVKVSAFDVAAGRRTEILKPNQQSIQTPNGGMQVRNVDVSEALDWKNGDFVFKEEPLAVIMRRVSRWYDVDVVYDAAVDQNQTFGGKVSRKRNISQVIKALQATQALKFNIEGKKVYVSN